MGCLDAYIPKDLSDEGKRRLVGMGKHVHVWCDKSANLIVDGTCQGAVHVEHGWGDAPAFSHILELCNNHEIWRTNYNEDGSIKPTKDDIAKQAANKFQVYPAERIKFQITEPLAALIS